MPDAPLTRRDYLSGLGLLAGVSLTPPRLDTETPINQGFRATQSNPLSPEIDGALMGIVLDNQVEPDTVAFLHADTKGARAVTATAQDHTAAETVARLSYDQAATDYTGTLDRLFANDPDAIGFAGNPDNARTILAQWDDGGYGGEWVLSSRLNTDVLIDAIPESMAAMYLIGSQDPTGRYPIYQVRNGDRYLIDRRSVSATPSPTGDGSVSERELPGRARAGEPVEASVVLSELYQDPAMESWTLRGPLNSMRPRGP